VSEALKHVLTPLVLLLRFTAGDALVLVFSLLSFG